MAKGVAPRVAPLLLLFAAAAEAGRKKEVVEKPLPSVSMQMLDLTLSPLKKLAAAYSEQVGLDYACFKEYYDTTFGES